jgi:hypothetical protein
MTPQQKRLQLLAESRNWGPFTDAQIAFMETPLRSSKSERTPFYAPELVRIAEKPFDNLQTILMPGEEPFSGDGSRNVIVTNDREENFHAL